MTPISQEVEKPFEQSFFFKYCLGMFMENRINGSLHFSLGRVMLSLLVMMGAYFWLWEDKDVPATLGTLILVVAGYVLGSKAIDTGKSMVSTVAGAVKEYAAVKKEIDATKDEKKPA
jgi:hypothetical protein